MKRMLEVLLIFSLGCGASSCLTDMRGEGIPVKTGKENWADEHWIDGNRVKLWNRPPMEGNESALLPNAGPEPRYYVIRDQNTFDDVKRKTGLENLLKDKNPDFKESMVLGAVDEAAPMQRNFRVYRVMELPECVEVQVISFPRKKLEENVSPYLFVILPRSEKPVRFFYNSAYAWGEALEPLEPGLHHEGLTRRYLYTVCVPEKAEKPAPLILYLHGSTTTGAKNAQKYFEEAKKRGYIVVAPTCRNGYYWTENNDYGPIFDILGEVMARYPVDPTRVYLGGGSAGGHTSYGFAAEHPNIFAGFFAVVGRLNPSVSDEEVARLKDKPVYVLCGDSDELVPLKAVQAGVDRLKAAGAKVTLRVVEGGGHAMTKDRPELISELFDWLDIQAFAPKPSKE